MLFTSIWRHLLDSDSSNHSVLLKAMWETQKKPQGDRSLMTLFYMHFTAQRQQKNGNISLTTQPCLVNTVGPLQKQVKKTLTTLRFCCHMEQLRIHQLRLLIIRSYISDIRSLVIVLYIKSKEIQEIYVLCFVLLLCSI